MTQPGEKSARAAQFFSGLLDKYDIPSRNFVRQWIEHPEQLDIMKQSFQSQAQSILNIRDLVAKGKLTE